MNYDLAHLKHCVEQRSSLKPDWLISGQPVVLYGAGNLGREILEILQASQIKVAAFIDGMKEAVSEQQGVWVYPLQHEKVKDFASQKTPVLITIHNYLCDMQAVVQTLKQLGFSKIATICDYFEYFSQEIKEPYWLVPSSFYLENYTSYENGLAIWEDEFSRELYRRVLWYRFGHEVTAYPRPEAETQYAPKDVPRWAQPLRLLDGGACQGHALQVLLQEGYAIEHLYAWEPDLSNYKKLDAYLRTCCPDLPTTLFPCGLSSGTDIFRFNGDRGAASGISETGKDQIITLSADSALAHQAISLIKLDIEGMEAKALQGMQRLILKNHPGLAICVYHRAEDLYAIPNLIKSWNLPYRFYLRAHGWHTFDVVMYALPF